MNASMYYNQIWGKSLLLPVSTEDILIEANKNKELIVWRIRNMPSDIVGQLELRGDTLWLFSNDKLSPEDARIVFARFLVDIFNKNYKEVYTYNDVFNKDNNYYESLRILLPRKALETLVTRCRVNSFEKLSEAMWIEKSHIYNLCVEDNIFGMKIYSR